LTRHDPSCRVRARCSDLARSSSPPGCGPRAGAMDVPNWTFEHLAESWTEVKKRGRDQGPIASRGVSTGSPDLRPSSADYRRRSVGSNRR
jgi:hypothetical protein